MLKRSVQITLGIMGLCFAAVMFYAAVRDGLVTLAGIVHLVGCGFTIAAVLPTFWDETTPTKSS